VVVTGNSNHRNFEGTNVMDKFSDVLKQVKERPGMFGMKPFCH